MEKEIIELLVDNTGVSTEQAKIITKEIRKIHLQDEIYYWPKPSGNQLSAIRECTL